MRQLKTQHLAPLPVLDDTGLSDPTRETQIISSSRNWRDSTKSITFPQRLALSS